MLKSHPCIMKIFIPTAKKDLLLFDGLPWFDKPISKINDKNGVKFAICVHTNKNKNNISATS